MNNNQVKMMDATVVRGRHGIPRRNGAVPEQAARMVRTERTKLVSWQNLS
jgi:hypothetical protein